MRKHIFLLCCAALAFMASCSSEDELTPDRDTNTDCFAPDPSATDAESVLRRNFKQEEGSYLLFNDTLRKEYLGKDYNGIDRYFTETVGIDYIIGGTAPSSYQQYLYNYLTTQSEKEAAVTFLKNKVLNHLPKTLRPFSWLVVKNIILRDQYNGDTYYDAKSGQRCVAVAVGDIAEADQDALAKTILITTLSNKLESKAKELEAFYAVSENDYGQYFGTDDNPDYDEDINMKHLRDHGFIVKSMLWGVIEVFGYYPDKTRDMSSFTNLIMTTSMDDIKAKYAGYPLVIEKAQLLYDIFKSIGYIF